MSDLTDGDLVWDDEPHRPHDRFCGCDSCTDAFYPGIA